MNFERHLLQATQDEARDDGGVLARRILLGPEDVEVAEPDGLDPVEAAPHRRVLLAGRLGDGIGRNRRRILILAFRQIWTVAVDGGRRRVDDATNAGATGSFQYVQRPGDVVVVGPERILHRARNRTHRRLMEDDVDAEHDYFDRVQIPTHYIDGIAC